MENQNDLSQLIAYVRVNLRLNRLYLDGVLKDKPEDNYDKGFNWGYKFALERSIEGLESIAKRVGIENV